jgi:molecular chaperone GrpE
MGKKKAHDNHQETSAQPAPAAQSAEDDLLADVQRLQADFENYRKRIERDREQHQKLAAEALVRELLPVLDNLSLALEHAQSDPQHLADGVTMIREQLWHALAARGVEEVPTDGAFDPQLHQAIEKVTDTSKPNNTIVQTLQRGYRLAGKVLQPARVRVVKNTEAS